MIRSTPRIEALPATTPFIGPEALARENHIADETLLRLGANESGFGASPQVYSAITRELPRISYYGDPELFLIREQLASLLGLSASEVLVASGIDDLIGLFLRAYMGEGGTAIAGSGTYPTFFYHVNASGGRCETVAYNGTAPDLDLLAERAIAHKPSLIYLANPDNPGSGFYGRARLSAFLAAIPEETLILLDEAYIEYVPGDEVVELNPQPNLVRLRTFSKAYGLAGMRIGYALADPAVNATINKIRQHFGVVRPSALAACAALDDQAFVAHVVAETARGREEYAQFAHDIGVRTYPSATNFTLFECGSVDRAVAVVADLLKLGVFIRKPGSGPLASCVRITVGTPEERARLREPLAQTMMRRLAL